MEATVVEEQGFFAKVLDWLTNTGIPTGIKIVISLVILVIAFRIINVISRKIQKKTSAKFDATLAKTLCYVGKVLAKIVVVTCLVGFLGIDTSGIAALIASLGVCVGLAVNGALSNLAGGILLIITRPFKIGDYISAQGQEGVVEDIRITVTKIITVDNKVVYLPNGALSSGTIVNFSEKDLRRVDLTFSVAGNDPQLVKQLILDVCNADEKVEKEPATFVRVCDYGAGNGVKVVMRAWTKSASYWDTYFDLTEGIQAAFEKNGIVIPFNQLDVHIKNN